MAILILSIAIITSVIYQTITHKGLKKEKYRTDKVSSAKWNIVKMNSPLPLFLLLSATSDLTRLSSKLMLISLLIILLVNMIIFFDKPKLFENGVYIDTQRINWTEIENYDLNRIKSSEFYLLTINTRINKSRKSLLLNKRRTYELVFNKDKVTDVKKLLISKTHHLT